MEEKLCLLVISVFGTVAKQGGEIAKVVATVPFESGKTQSTKIFVRVECHY